MEKVIGFIGSGNMGGAMIGGIIRSGLVSKEYIYVSDINKASLERVKLDYGVNVTTDNIEVATVSDMIVLAVKPYLYPAVIGEI